MLDSVDPRNIVYSLLALVGVQLQLVRIGIVVKFIEECSPVLGHLTKNKTSNLKPFHQ